jgi:para-nitrobenzyl esterase
VYRYLYSKLRPPLADQSRVAGLAGGTNAKDGKAPVIPQPVGAPHACEIEYCMGNLDLIKDYLWTAEDHKVSATMLNYFANFIIKGNPNGDQLPVWPAAEANDTTPSVMIIDTESKTVEANNDSRYLFLDKLFKNQ